MELEVTESRVRTLSEERYELLDSKDIQASVLLAPQPSAQLIATAIDGDKLDTWQPYSIFQAGKIHAMS